MWCSKQEHTKCLSQEAGRCPSMSDGPIVLKGEESERLGPVRL